MELKNDALPVDKEPLCPALDERAIGLVDANALLGKVKMDEPLKEGW